MTIKASTVPLSEAERAELDERGYIVRVAALSGTECDEICARVSTTIAMLCHTAESNPAAFDQDFRSSGDRTAVFWEKSAPDPASVAPADRERCVVRLGHGLHVDDDVFRRAAAHPAIVGALASVIPAPICIVDSVIFYKQPFVGSELSPHQDASYLRTEPETLYAGWIALDDADDSNGCLRVVPGSHRAALHERPAVSSSGRVDRPPPLDPELASASRPLEVARGSVVIYHGRLYHGSGANRSPRPRRAFVAHYASARSEWLSSNLFARPERGFAEI